MKLGTAGMDRAGKQHLEVTVTCTTAPLAGLCNADRSQASGFQTLPAKTTINHSLPSVPVGQRQYWGRTSGWGRERGENTGGHTREASKIKNIREQRTDAGKISAHPPEQLDTVNKTTTTLTLRRHLQNTAQPRTAAFCDTTRG